MNGIDVAVLGATSYTGLELVRLLAAHPLATIVCVSSQSYAGKRLSEVFPAVSGVCDRQLSNPDQVLQQAPGVQCVFSCLPHAVSAQSLLPFIDKGIRVVDLSADFRIRDASVYQHWYGAGHPRADLLQSSVYGLPEHYREAVRGAQIVANPGCYPTGILLSLLPLLKTKGVELFSLIADAKSGVSGAGRSLKLAAHFVEANENLTAYSVGRSHRHVPEIEQELGAAAGKPMTLTFVPHLAPLSRGILTTMYVGINVSAKQCERIVADAYKDEPFVRVRSDDGIPALADVRSTNFCDIAFAGGSDGEPVIAVSAIDNLLKGASGQAVQNMNIMFGFDETMGLS